MSCTLRAFAFASTLALAACGGGGGGAGTGSTGIGSGPSPVAISPNNAKAVGANALDAAQDISAPSGVTVVSAAANLPQGAVVSQTGSCGLGGSATISGSVAHTGGPAVGDTLTLVASNCAQALGNGTIVTNGQIAVSVASGTLTSLPLHAVVAASATNFSVQGGGITVVANGDVRLDWTAASAASQTLVASGTSLSVRETIGGTSHTTTLRNYSQAVTFSGSSVASTLSASIETDSTRVAATPVSYTIATTAPVMWDAAARMATAGAIHVTGANNSQLLLTINTDGTATLQVDANGDGSYETTIQTNTAELAGLV